MKTLKEIYEENKPKSDHFIIAYLTNRADFFKSIDEIDEDLLLDMRAFNNDEELKIWKNADGELSFRNKSDEGEYAETEFIMWGDNIDKGVITEANRGARITPPFEVKKNDLPLKIRIINYFTYDDVGLISFTDARYAGIIPGGGAKCQNS